MINLEKFNSLYWHDAQLLNIEIDRSNPGEKDTVTVVVKWPNGKVSNVLFEECYLLDIKMNFGIIAEESILSAVCRANSTQLVEIQSKWRALGVELDDLLVYEITTNSTNSLLKIYARSMSLEDL